MDLNKAKKVAIELMAKYCPEYSFDFDRSKRRFGCCHITKKRITLSKALTELNSEEEVKNCVLHEIAHALTPYDHHNGNWKNMAKDIGYVGGRTHNAKMPEPRYVYVCPNCGNEYKQFRKSIRMFNCGVCYSRTKVKYPLELVK